MGQERSEEEGEEAGAAGRGREGEDCDGGPVGGVVELGGVAYASSGEGAEGR